MPPRRSLAKLLKTGALQLENWEIPEALETFTDAVKLAPENVDAIWGLASAQMRSDDDRACKKTCEAAAHLKSFKLNAILAEIKKRAGDTDAAAEALLACEPLIASDEERAYFHYDMACYQNLLGNTDDALDHLEKAIAGLAIYRPRATQDPDLASLNRNKRFRALTE